MPAAQPYVQPSYLLQMPFGPSLGSMPFPYGPMWPGACPGAVYMPAAAPPPMAQPWQVMSPPLQETPPPRVSVHRRMHGV
jgi:hypothetical protein